MPAVHPTSLMCAISSFDLTILAHCRLADVDQGGGWQHTLELAQILDTHLVELDTNAHPVRNQSAHGDEEAGDIGKTRSTLLEPPVTGIRRQADAGEQFRLTTDLQPCEDALHRLVVLRRELPHYVL